jgi:hypothetical protein
MLKIIDSIKALRKLREFLAGKKTYISAITFGLLAGLRYYGVEIPVFVWPLLTAVGLGSVRAALKKGEKSN